MTDRVPITLLLPRNKFSIWCPITSYRSWNKPKVIWNQKLVQGWTIFPGCKVWSQHFQCRCSSFDSWGRQFCTFVWKGKKDPIHIWVELHFIYLLKDLQHTDTVSQSDQFTLILHAYYIQISYHWTYVHAMSTFTFDSPERVFWKFLRMDI